MKTLGIALAALVFAGCAHNYDVKAIQRPDPLNPAGSALVAMPQDGKYGDVNYPGSGSKCAREIAAAFGKHLARVDIMESPTSSEAELAAARSGGFDYLVIPMVAQWEDRATEWSGRRDKIEIVVRTTRVSDGKSLSLGTISGRSRYGSLYSGGGDQPEDMLAAPIGAYVDSLFTPPGTPIQDPNKPKK